MVFLISTFVLWATSPGIRPRADASSYPTHNNQPDFSIGAALIPPDLAKKMFKLDMNHAGYVVVEVGVFPAPGRDLDLYPSDFTLYAGDDKIASLRPVSSDTIVEKLDNKPRQPQLPDPLGLHPWAGVARGHGPTGSATDAAAGVSVGDPPSKSGCAGSVGEVTARWKNTTRGGRVLVFPKALAQDERHKVGTPLRECGG